LPLVVCIMNLAICAVVFDCQGQQILQLHAKQTALSSSSHRHHHRRHHRHHYHHRHRKIRTFNKKVQKEKDATHTGLVLRIEGGSKGGAPRRPS